MWYLNCICYHVISQLHLPSCDISAVFATMWYLNCICHHVISQLYLPSCDISTVFAIMWYLICICHYIPVNPPPFRGSLPRKSLISRLDWVSCAGDINLPHTPFPPPNKKIKYNQILTYILRSIFLEIPHLELLRWWKTPRDTNGKGV